MVFLLGRRDSIHVLTHVSELRISRLRAAFAALAAVCCCAFFAASAGALTYTVDSSADTATPDACTAVVGDCTLRGAITTANANAGSDVIEFEPSLPTPLTINSTLPPVTGTVTIDGDGGMAIIGSVTYTSACTTDDYALTTTGAQAQVLGLPILNVCGRAIKSSVAAPSIRVGPRRADNTVPINGSAPNGSVEIFRADAPAGSGEALSLFKDSVPAVGGGYSYVPPSVPTPSEKFTATVTDGSGTTSTFAAPASAPADLVSPGLIRAVGVANNAVRLDFDEPVAGVGGATGAFALNMGGINRQITSVDVSGSSVYLGSASTPWSTGEAGSVSFTGNGRVTDLMGNELLGQPSAVVFAGPGELSLPTISRYRVSPATFCRKKTRKCTKRKQTYLYITLSKPSRVTFNILKAGSRGFVARYVRKLEAGTTKTRLMASMSGRTLPLGKLVVQAVAEDQARNLSIPAEAAFKTVSRNSQL